MEQNKELPENELPAQVLESIGHESVEVTKQKAAGRSYAYRIGFEDGYFTGATEYAIWKVKLDEALALLEESHLQIEYMQSRFGETGTGNNVLSRIKSFLDGK